MPMSRSARILLAAAAMMMAAAAPAAAQSARGTVTASATVVEPIGFVAGPSTVAASRGAIDVTTPVAVQGRAAHVVKVVRASDAQPPVATAIRPHPRATSPFGATESAYDVRLRLPPQQPGAPAAVTYVISTVN
jgi:hypothetical protein